MLAPDGSRHSGPLFAPGTATCPDDDMRVPERQQHQSFSSSHASDRVRLTLSTDWVALLSVLTALFIMVAMLLVLVVRQETNGDGHLCCFVDADNMDRGPTKEMRTMTDHFSPGTPAALALRDAPQCAVAIGKLKRPRGHPALRNTSEGRRHASWSQHRAPCCEACAREGKGCQQSTRCPSCGVLVAGAPSTNGPRRQTLHVLPWPASRPCLRIHRPAPGAASGCDNVVPAPAQRLGHAGVDVTGRCCAP